MSFPGLFTIAKKINDTKSAISYSWGSGGRFEPPSSQGKSPGGGPGGKAPRSPQNPLFHST